MALNKEIIKENGIVMNYHKISSINLHTTDTESRLIVTVESFLNKDFREKNCSILSTNHIFTIQSNEDTDIGIRTLGYQKLKELEIFNDAEDC